MGGKYTRRSTRNYGGRLTLTVCSRCSCEFTYVLVTTRRSLCDDCRLVQQREKNRALRKARIDDEAVAAFKAVPRIKPKRPLVPYAGYDHEDRALRYGFYEAIPQHRRE